MTTTVSMPQLGESVTEGTVTRWLKGVGDQINVDEPLLEVSTDKVDTEIPSPVSGVLLEIVAPTDSTVAVGGVVAVIGESNAAARALYASAGFLVDGRRKAYYRTAEGREDALLMSCDL